MMTRSTMIRAVAGLILGLTAPMGSWAAEAPQRVELETADGVELVARYLPGPLNNKSPTVLIIDGLGDNRRPDTCDAIAAELHREGCATLCFDFRGHGASKSVTESFWDFPTNRRFVRGYKSNSASEQISFNDFKTGYLRMLVNDIAVARAFLERRNDAGECNSGHLLVVGLREGATIGAMWVASEWNRYRMTGGLNTRLSGSSEGRDILGCVWVEPELDLDRQKVPLTDWVKRAVNKRTTYVGLIHSTDDASLTKVARLWADTLNKKGGRMFQVTAIDITKGDSVTDHMSLVSSVAEMIAQMRKVQDSPPWDNRNFADKRYAWSLPGGGVVPAKDEDERILKLVPIDRLLAR